MRQFSRRPERSPATNSPARRTAIREEEEDAVHGEHPPRVPAGEAVDQTTAVDAADDPAQRTGQQGVGDLGCREVVLVGQEEHEEDLRHLAAAHDGVAQEEPSQGAHGEGGAPALTERLRLVFGANVKSKTALVVIYLLVSLWF